MATYDITLTGNPYTLSTVDAAQIAAITAARVAYNGTIPDTQEAPRVDHDNYRATDAAYLEFVYGDWAVANPEFTNEQLQESAASTFASYAGQDIPVPAPEELSPEEVKARLVAYAADKRYRVEIGGTTINGQPMATDRDTQAKLTGAFLLAQVDPQTTFEWKAPSGFVTLTAEQVQGIAAAVGAFVQAAYACERAVLEGIAADTITSEAQVDGAAWPT